jgi:hypothetical protein
VVDENLLEHAAGKGELLLAGNIREAGREDPHAGLVDYSGGLQSVAAAFTREGTPGQRPKLGIERVRDRGAIRRLAFLGAVGHTHHDGSRDKGR